MMIVRYYQMTAAMGQGLVLYRALVELADQLKPLPGFEGVELLVDDRDAESYIFLERWSSIESQEAAGKALGKAAFMSIMASLARPPDARSLVAMPLFESRP